MQQWSVAVFTKLKAADALLDSAVAALVDQRDYLAAIVLAGSAEDVFQGCLQREGRLQDSVRSYLVRHMILHESPDEAPLSPYKFVREVFNWLRHNDLNEEPQTFGFDAEAEAFMAVEQALVNRHVLDGTLHGRYEEVKALEHKLIGHVDSPV